jgi:chitinase domain-containing protein 1
MIEHLFQMKYYRVLFIGLCFLYPIESTLGPGNRKSPRNVEKSVSSKSSKPSSPASTIPKESLPPSETNVLQRDLLREDVTVRSILENYGSYCSSCSDIRQFTNPILIYITPWNNRGYDLVKLFPQKFDYICPVWFSLKRIDLEKYHLEGTHDIDSKWIETLKEKRSDVRIVPRVILENWSIKDIHALFQSENEKQQLSLTLKNFLIEYNHLFDGYVLEILAQFQGSSKVTIHHILSDIAEQIHAIETNTTRKKEVFLAVPPVEDIFNQEDFEILSKYIDGFNIMTYDFPTNKQPGPVAPIGNSSSSFFSNNKIKIFVFLP